MEYERDERIKDAKEETSEDGYIIAFNIGYDDYPVWESPFAYGSKQHRGYVAGVLIAANTKLFTEKIRRMSAED